MNGSGTALPGTFVTAMRENLEELRRNRGWILILGIVLIVIGCCALTSAFIATLATMLFFGLMMMLGGILEVVGSFWVRHWGGFFLGLVMGVLLFLAGMITLNHPGEAGLFFTLMLGLLFMTGGLVRILSALTMRFTNWGWVFLSGIITFLLGLMIWRQWPFSGLWVIGTFVGIDLIFSGGNYVALASWLKRPRPHAV
jgi:uncharacterized membrane protein HdeD (DUF308 family)